MFVLPRSQKACSLPWEDPVGDSGAKKQQERAFPRAEVLLCVLVRNDPIDLENLDHRSPAQGDQDSETPWLIDSFVTKLGASRKGARDLRKHSPIFTPRGPLGPKFAIPMISVERLSRWRYSRPEKAKSRMHSAPRQAIFGVAGHQKFWSAHNLSSLALDFGRLSAPREQPSKRRTQTGGTAWP
jgi:hypothetical protein